MQLLLSPSGRLIVPAQAYVQANRTSSPELVLKQDSFINRLPAETLSRVFEYINEHVDFRPGTSQWVGFANTQPVNLVPLMLTCRRWHAFVEPILYRSLFLTFNTKNGLRTRYKLQRTLLSQHALCQHVQHLYLVFHSDQSRFFGSGERRGPDGEADIVAASRLLKHFRPKTMVLAGDWDKDIDPRLCLPLARFEIEELTVYQSWIEFVFRYLEWGLCTSLKHLKLSSCRHYAMLRASEKWPRGRFADVDVPLERRRSLPLDSLEVVGGDVSAIEVGVICQYAAALRTLELRHLMHAAYDWTFDRIGIQNLLDMHHDSLENISLSIFFHGDGRALDFSACSRLKVLKISDYNLFLDTPEQAGRNMSQLERLTVDTDVGDQQISGLGKFDMTSAEWIEKFSIVSNIKKIHVLFEWSEDRMEGRYGGEQVPDQPWPNTHLKALQARLEEIDVELTWSGGTMTEEEWNAELERLREEHLQEHVDESESLEDSDSEPESDAEAEAYRLPTQMPAEGDKQRRIDHMFVRR